MGEGSLGGRVGVVLRSGLLSVECHGSLKWESRLVGIIIIVTHLLLVLLAASSSVTITMKCELRQSLMIPF